MSTLLTFARDCCSIASTNPCSTYEAHWVSLSPSFFLLTGLLRIRGWEGRARDAAPVEGWARTLLLVFLKAIIKLTRQGQFCKLAGNCGFTYFSINWKTLFTLVCMGEGQEKLVTPEICTLTWPFLGISPASCMHG